MISIDNAQNEIGLAGHIDDGKEWASGLLKKADEQIQQEEKLPTVIGEEAVDIEGTQITVKVLDTGQRVIDAQNIQQLFNWLESGENNNDQ
ncbi:hypothetical protein [Xenorhabdus hominickii]|uniref:Uncharacterized protein n=1 Tax=Xenorhabdus hominickii TaxID=351679 RepID=A0A1D7P5T4_XENHO|nr:hypothetical protein [Xenorhabdus hominickii]AOM40436.1 hypothetical protein A9255_07500 [Xenorhabdus hominickii]AOM42591.1 hypothetical protein A9255_19810 [Xenorhabdus hominickii]PHM48540.1 hypothetical protein Xhom_05033 [Xenorhabdus hominickii]